MLQPPSWQKDALPTGRGWAHPRTGELLKATRLSTADINDYLGIPKNKPVVISVEEAQEMIDIQPANVTDPDLLVEEEAPDMSNMTKLEIEAYGRTQGIELDRRKSKAAMINTLNEG
tara:strand:+ start:898 stop:1248 length:351 start_codon:yes stop_codon:yes gene_type:complete